MAPYTNTPGSPRDSISLFEDIEMNGFMKNGAEQESRLLGDEELGDSNEQAVEYVEECRPWVFVVGSIFTMGLIIFGLISLATYFVANPAAMKKDDLSQSSNIVHNFRRPESEYILDPHWDFQAAPKTREYNWTIMDIIANPDGIFRSMITINGQFPGPLIECNEGDTLIINLDNQSINSTSLHFHGIFQNGSNWMDGTPGITQCPIAPKRTFQYKFTVSGQSGTYFYHSHTALQSADGLVGPLVVHERDERDERDERELKYISDRVIMLQDHYHESSSGLLFDNLLPGREGSPIPDGGLINGLNHRDCSKFPTRKCDNLTTYLSNSMLEENANHRLRFINVGVLSYFHVSIDGHEMAITEADGTNLVPSYDTKLLISPAQRYSVVISTSQRAKSTKAARSFWLRARMMLHCIPDTHVPESTSQVLGIITYTNDNLLTSTSKSSDSKFPPLSLPASTDWAQTPLLECLDQNSTSLIPLSSNIHQPFPQTPTLTYNLTTNLEIGPYQLERAVINGSTFHPNLKHPILHSAIQNLNSNNTTIASSFQHDGINPISNNLMIQHKHTEVVDIILRSYDENSHPMHLHGHKFWVLGAGHGGFPGYASLGFEPDGQGPLLNYTSDSNALSDFTGRRRLENPIKRDTATLPGFGWLAIRFVADNPGVWAFHCHVGWHGEKGFGMVFLSGVDVVRGWKVPVGNLELCDSDRGELEKGAAPNDQVFMDEREWESGRWAIEGEGGVGVDGGNEVWG